MARGTRRRRGHKRLRGVGGYHTLKGFVSPRKHSFRLKRRSRFKRRLRGYRINPGLAAYSMMNPRHRRHRGRRHARLNPMVGGLMKSVTGVFSPSFIMQGGGAVVGAVAVITVSNMAAAYLVPYLPAGTTTGPIGIVVKAAVRGGVAYGLDRFVGPMMGRMRNPARVGMGLAIVGSALLEVLGKSFVLGQGDGAQTVQSFMPGSLAGYLTPRMPGMGRTGAYAISPDLGAYSRPRLAGVPSGIAGTGNTAHRKLYGGD
jgi:hypothetical protein